MKGGTLVNLVLLAPNNLPDIMAKSVGGLDEMHQLFQNWDPWYGLPSLAVLRCD